MSTTPDRSIPFVSRRLAILAVAGLALAAGCDDSGTTAQISGAQAKLLSVSAGGVAAPAESRKRTYQAVIADLQRVAADAEGVAQETALALTGEAQSGLAQLELAEALPPASELASLLTTIRVAAGEFASQSAAAAAMRSGDSGADLDRIATEAQRVAQEMDEARLDREGLVGRVAQLNRQQQEQREQATSIRTQEADLRQQAIRASSTERAEFTDQAYRLARRAAEFERAASDLQAQSEILLPEVRNAEIREQQLQTLAAQLTATRRSIEGERARRLEDSDAAQRVGDEAERRVDQLLAQIEETLTNGFEPAVNEAIAAYGRAVGTLRRSNNRLALAAAQQALGDAHRLRASTLEQAVSVMRHLSTIQPAPSVASRAASLEGDLQARVDEANAAAAQAFADSAASLRAGGSRAQGDARDRVNAAVETLEALASSLRGEPAPDEEPAGEDEFSED